MRIYHITGKADWERAQGKGQYSADTLASDGFIHCCFDYQVDDVQKEWFSGQSDLVLLEIDDHQLESEVRIEKSPPANERYPHVYGAIPIKAVKRVITLGSDYLFHYEIKEKTTEINRLPIPIEQLVTQPYSLWKKRWLLLCCGDYAKSDFNMMTVAWGGLGCMWDKPLAITVVRHSRYTHQFMERFHTFTLSVFPEDLKDKLTFLGTKSGRDTDKITQCGLTPIKSQLVAAPSFAEAEMIIECRKMYWEDMNPSHFIDVDIWEKYPDRDFHRTYFGDILAVMGVEKYIHS